MNSAFKRLLIIFLFLFVSLRLFHLPQSVEFGSDEGRDFLTTWNIYKTHRLTLIGPPSEFTINGREFYFGPAPYYVILPFLILGNGNPLTVFYALVFLNTGIFLISLLILNKHSSDKATMCFFAIFYIFTPALITYTRSYWNPYFMLLISLLITVLLVGSKKKMSKPFLFYPLIGFLFGLGMQFHYSFILSICISMVWLLVNKKLTVSMLAYLLAGFVIGFLPIIVFELRNNFYNLNTLLLVLNKSENLHNNFTLRSFYLISLIPFLLFLLSKLMARVYKVSKPLSYVMAGLFVAYSLFSLVSSPIRAFNLPALEKMANIIAQDNPSQFNIVDQLSGDNRAMALRYLLTAGNYAPMGVTEYPSAQTLYVYSELPINRLLKNPIWELSSDKQLVIEGEWKVSDGILLYKLIKKPSSTHKFNYTETIKTN